MRKTIAFGIAMLSSAACMAQPEAVAAEPLMLAQTGTTRTTTTTNVRRATVPRSTGVGLSTVPLATTTIFGLSPVAAAIVGVVVVGGVIAASASDDDPAAPSGTGTGTGGN